MIKIGVKCPQGHEYLFESVYKEEEEPLYFNFQDMSVTFWCDKCQVWYNVKLKERLK